MTSTFCEECGIRATHTPAFCGQCGHPLRPAAVATRTQAATTAPATRSAPAPEDQPLRSPGITQPQAPTAAFRGVSESFPGRRSSSSKAWVYYLILAVASLLGVFAGKPIGLVGAVVCGAYSYYLYNGGRVVVWFW